jgi:hypothetical protein
MAGPLDLEIAAHAITLWPGHGTNIEARPIYECTRGAKRRLTPIPNSGAGF